MMARVIATLRRWCRRASVANHQPELEDTRARQRQVQARAQALGIQVDVQTRRHRHVR